MAIPVSNDLMFNHINKLVAPITHKLYTTAKEKIIDGITVSQSFSENLFSNSTPRHHDSVHSAYSSTKVIKKLSKNFNGFQKKIIQQKDTSKSPQDNYTVEEEALLRRIFNKTQ